jgi:hypothetical protein
MRARELMALLKATTEITIHTPTIAIPNKVSIERLLYLMHDISVVRARVERNLCVRPNPSHCTGPVPVRCCCEWSVRHPVGARELCGWLRQKPNTLFERHFSFSLSTEAGSTPWGRLRQTASRMRW